MLVKNNQKIFNKTAIETGCLTIFLSKVSPSKIFNKKIRRKPANMGSVGMETSTGVFGTNSVSKIDKGVKKTETKKISFKSVRAYQTIKKINGIKTP